MRCSVRSIPARLSSPKYPDPLFNMPSRTGHVTLGKVALRVLESRLRTTPKIHDNFDQRSVAIRGQLVPHRVRNRNRQGQQHLIQVVDHLVLSRPTVDSRGERCLALCLNQYIVLASPAFRHRLLRLLNRIEPTTPLLVAGA